MEPVVHRHWTENRHYIPNDFCHPGVIPKLGDEKVRLGGVIEGEFKFLIGHIKVNLEPNGSLNIPSTDSTISLLKGYFEAIDTVRCWGVYLGEAILFGHIVCHEYDRSKYRTDMNLKGSIAETSEALIKLA